MAAMIRLQLPDEPADFHDRVRAEGLAHLQEQNQDPEQPRMSPSIWKSRKLPDGSSHTPDYWRRAREAIRSGYDHRCVYSCFKLEDEAFPGGTRCGGSVDHFKPRETSAAKLAYEWSNLRWAWAKIDNEYKKNNIIPDDHDPVNIEGDLFMLEEHDDGNLLVVPNPSLPGAERARVRETIQKLGLNKTPVILARTNCFKDFIDEKNSYSHSFMEEMQPFVYYQMIAGHAGLPGE
jgi:hypothetical protein